MIQSYLQANKMSYIRNEFVSEGETNLLIMNAFWCSDGVC